jgi:LysM repeat protein
VNESSQGRYALLIVFISFMLVIGSILTAFAETSYSSGENQDSPPTQEVTDIVFITITNSLAPTAFPSETPNPPTPSATTEDPTSTSENPTVPPTINPTNTPSSSSAACTPPTGWITYTVRSGDNLFKISKAFGSTVPELQAANCMGSSTTIITGSQVWVPNVATITPTPTKTPKPSKTPTITPIPSDTPPPPNTPPVANPDTYSIAVGETLDIDVSLGVLTNDTEEDDGPEPLTAIWKTGPVCASSSLTLKSDGSFIFSTDITVCTVSDTFTYAAYDGVAESEPVTVTITLP